MNDKTFISELEDFYINSDLYLNNIVSTYDLGNNYSYKIKWHRNKISDSDLKWDTSLISGPQSTNLSLCHTVYPNR